MKNEEIGFTKTFNKSYKDILSLKQGILYKLFLIFFKILNSKNALDHRGDMMERKQCIVNQKI